MDPKLDPMKAPVGVPGVTLKVIGAGISRTGTKTFAQAMTILYNLPVHDAAAQSMGGKRRTRKNWLEVMHLAPVAKTVADKEKLKYLLASNVDGYVATTDTPVCYFTKELAELYPEAVVVVTTRDKESWIKSLYFMQEINCVWWLYALIWPVPKYGVFGHWMNTLFKFYAWKFGTENLQAKHLTVHEDLIKASVPEDRLFFYNVKDGWEPLCKRLGLPVPSVPFPHNNDRGAAMRDRNIMVVVGLSAWLIWLGGIGLSSRYLWNRFQ